MHGNRLISFVISQPVCQSVYVHGAHWDNLPLVCQSVCTCCTLRQPSAGVSVCVYLLHIETAFHWCGAKCASVWGCLSIWVLCDAWRCSSWLWRVLDMGIITYSQLHVERRHICLPIIQQAVWFHFCSYFCAACPGPLLWHARSIRAVCCPCTRPWLLIWD